MATVAAQLSEGTVVDIQARQFSWRGDEPLGERVTAECMLSWSPRKRGPSFWGVGRDEL